MDAVNESEIDAASSSDGRLLREALSAAGLAGRPRVVGGPGRYIGYLEGHIEQGATLESENLKIGIVTGIVGMRWYRITFVGQENHAGTTRMALRKDAGVALAKFCVAIDDRFPKICGPWTVWTIGRVTLEPGSNAVVPGRAEMVLNIRDEDPRVLDRLEEALASMTEEFNVTGPCHANVENIRSLPVVGMDPVFQQVIETAGVNSAPGKCLRMPSGAGHDAQSLAAMMPVGMLFVPSIGGISHHWSENTSDADIVLGAQAFVEACRRLLTE